MGFVMPTLEDDPAAVVIVKPRPSEYSSRSPELRGTFCQIRVLKREVFDLPKLAGSRGRNPVDSRGVVSEATAVIARGRSERRRIDVNEGGEKHSLIRSNGTREQNLQ
jgi:hypothetical protein